MTMQTIALAGGAILMLLVLLVLRRRRTKGGEDAHAEVERPTPILANPASLPAAEAGGHTHMGPPAPEPMDWPPFPPSAAAAAASDAAARAEQARDEPPARQRPEPAPPADWAPPEVVDAPGWPMPGEMDMGWVPAPAMAGAAYLNGPGARVNGTGPPHASDADGSSPDGLLSDARNGFDPAAGWSDDSTAGETAETSEMEPIEPQHVAEAEPSSPEPHAEGFEAWSVPADVTTPDPEPLDWSLPPEDEEDRAWAAFAGDEPVMAVASPDVPTIDGPPPAPDAGWAMLAPAPEPPALDPPLEWEEPEVESPPSWAMPAAAEIPEAADPARALATEPEADWLMPVAPPVSGPEPAPLAAAQAPPPAPDPVAEVAVRAPARAQTPETAVAWYDESLPEPGLTPVAWWDEAGPEGPAIAEAPAGEVATGRFALGGFAPQPGHEALGGVTFRAPLAAAPERWELAGTEPATPGALVVQLDGALNCDRDELAVLTAAGFAPTPEGFTLRVAARASGPFAASGTFRIAA